MKAQKYTNSTCMLSSQTSVVQDVLQLWTIVVNSSVTDVVILDVEKVTHYQGYLKN